MRWWPWRRKAVSLWEPPHRIADGDTVLLPGQRPWADLVHPHHADTRTRRPRGWDEPTAAYRTIRVPPWLRATRHEQGDPR